MRTLFFVLAISAPAARAAGETLARYPQASSREMVFVAHGDLWIAPRDGGAARRLVRCGGWALAPRFSPDGLRVAYTERRGGAQDVFVVSTAGGAPRQLTFDGQRAVDGNLVTGWTPDGASVVFLSHRGAWASKVLRAFTAPADGGPAVRLPLEQAGLLSFSPDGRSIAFNRSFTAFDARKRYVGGKAPDIWTYDLQTHRALRLTNWKGTDSAPMWWRRRIYFLSDRGAGFRLNLWRYDLDDGRFTQVTHFADFDIDLPALGSDRITFQQAGRIWAVDLPDDRLHELPVSVPDDGVRTSPRRADATPDLRIDDVTGRPAYALSARGDMVLVAAHGDVFRVPVDAAPPTNLTSSPGVDEESPSPSPDGRWVAYVTEAEGAQQVAIRPLGGGPERRLTHFKSGVLYNPLWAPSGQAMAVADAEHGLWVVRLDGTGAKLVAHDPVAEIRDAAFSEDGGLLAYSTTRDTGQHALHLCDWAHERDATLTSPLESDRLPAFTSGGRTLAFVSQRHELPFSTDRGDETTISTLKSDGLYTVDLSGWDWKNGTLQARGLMAHAKALPIEPALIVSLESRSDRLFYEVRPPALIAGELPGEGSALHAFDLRGMRDRIIVRDLDSHALSADGDHILFRRNDEWRLAPADADATSSALTVTGLLLREDPKLEWQEMFERAWRLDRDLFFSRSMNGSDWSSVHEAYRRLLPRLGSRDDFLYLLTQLQGELATSHAFVLGLDAQDRSDPIRTRTLGADFAFDDVTGQFRFARVLGGDPSRARFRSPLAEAVPALKVGDVLAAVNGQPLTRTSGPDARLAGSKADVALTIVPEGGGDRRTVSIEPLQDDLDLRQYDWIEANRKRVSDLSGGSVGYLFLGDFGALGSADFVRQFQGQLDKQGLVIDVRWNRGGFTSQAVLDVLRRARVASFADREGALAPLPLFSPPRVMVALMNIHTASDGDQFAYYFKAYGLGPLVGERTWGGVQGIRGPWALMDGAAVTIPKDSLASADGRWIIENAGVEPDIEVSPAPDDAPFERDRQLDTAVSVLMARLRASPPAPLQRPLPTPSYPPAGDVPGSQSHLERKTPIG